MDRPLHRSLASALALVGIVALLAGLSVAEDPQPQPNDQKPGLAKTADLGGPSRYLTHLSTDKPIYRTGEKVYLRGVLLHADKHTPVLAEKQAIVQIRGPKGDVVASGWVQTQDSVLGFSWEVPAEQPGGEYTARVTFPNEGHPPAERKFDIRAYRAPRLKSQIVFVRDGYGPGDEVAATLHTERAEGGVPAAAPVTVIARVDGEEVHRGRASVDAEGNCDVRFQLPERIARGEGTLALVINDGGAVETASKTIPILLQTVDLSLYPEGGDLVAGLPARVYLEARTPAQKPADLSGVIVDADGKEVTTFRTEHEGRGRFAFTPREGGKYTLKINEPSGIKTTYPLPEVKPQGSVISSKADQYARDGAVQLNVAATAAGKYRVTLQKRENEVAGRELDLESGKVAEVELTPPASADGVLIATVWDAEGKPLAERLVYRQPAGQVHVTIEADRESYVPGGTARLKIRTTGAGGKPVGAVVGLTVTDESVLEMIETREQAPRLPVMVLLEDDVREMADAHVYLDETNADAPRDVDLLLGTQGWRRFAFVDATKFLAAGGDAARRVLALRMAKVHLATRGAAGIAGLVDDDADGAVAEGAVVVENAPAVPAAAPPDPGAPPVAPPPGADPQAQQKPQQGLQGQQVAGQHGLAAAEPPPAASRPALPNESQARRQLRKELDQLERKNEEAIVAGDLAKNPWPAQNDFVVVRQYAHQVRTGRQPGKRIDFTETLYWSAGVATDETTGEASVEFGLSDSVTSFRVLADAFTNAGALGEATDAIEVVEPFYVEPKLPLEVTSGDVVQLPIGLVNATGEQLDTKLIVRAAGGQAGGFPRFDLGGDERLRKLFTVEVAGFSGPTQFTFEGTAGPYANTVVRPLNVVPLGFPIEVAHGGLIDSATPAQHQIVISDQVVPGSLSTKLAIYPTPLANMTASLERLLQEPYGCFEQTSSTTYPLVMAQQYFQSHTGVDPAIIERANGLLAKGYKRLTSFECQKAGYEWFGEDPGHEALSAYGLMEFSDMAQVYTAVDPQMLQRTRSWVLNQRDGIGGFKRQRRALHTWITDTDVSNAYITWALLQAGEDDPTLSEEIASLNEAAGKTQNSYVLALAANVMAEAGEEQNAAKLMERLAKQQHKDGWLQGATQSIVGSGGEALKIEATSLAVLAWLQNPSYAGNVERAMKYLAESCEAGRYGSTQSTVLALKAIVEYDRSRAHPKAPGSVQLLIDGSPVGNPVSFDEDTQGAIELPDFAKWLTSGEHTIELKMQDGSNMPYSLAVNYHSVRPPSAEECLVDLSVALTKDKLDEGGVTEARVRVANKSDKAVPTPVAIVGIPGGLEVRHDQLKELVKSGQVAAYEVLGRDVVLYWREFKPSHEQELLLSLQAAVPGSYTGPASRAYLYYTDEFKKWTPGLHVEIAPK